MGKNQACRLIRRPIRRRSAFAGRLVVCSQLGRHRRVRGHLAFGAVDEPRSVCLRVYARHFARASGHIDKKFAKALIAVAVCVLAGWGFAVFLLSMAMAFGASEATIMKVHMINGCLINGLLAASRP